MLINQRIKQLRKEQGLTQDEFAARIGITKSSVSLLESGKNSPSTQTLQLICQQFGVRRDWLTDGTGPMRVPIESDDQLVDAVLAGEDEFIKAVIRGIAKTPGGWEKMREVFDAISAELQKNTPDP